MINTYLQQAKIQSLKEFKMITPNEMPMSHSFLLSLKGHCGKELKKV